MTNVCCSEFSDTFFEVTNNKENESSRIQSFFDQYSDNNKEINGESPHRVKSGIWNIVSLSLQFELYGIANAVLADKNFSKRSKQLALACIIKNKNIFSKKLTDIMHVLLNHSADFEPAKFLVTQLPENYRDIKKEESSEDGSKFFTNNGKVGKKGDPDVTFYERKKSKNKNIMSDGSVDTLARALKTLS